MGVRGQGIFQSHQAAQNLVKVALKLLTPTPLKGVRGVNFFEYILKYLSYERNFSLAQKTRLNTFFTYLEHDHVVNRKFFRTC